MRGGHSGEQASIMEPKELKYTVQRVVHWLEAIPSLPLEFTKDLLTVVNALNARLQVELKALETAKEKAEKDADANSHSH